MNVEKKRITQYLHDILSNTRDIEKFLSGVET